MSATARGALAASLAAAIWGGMYVVSRLVLGVIPPLTLLVIRFLVALPALWIWHGLTERRAVGWRWPSRRAWLDLAVIGGVGYCLSLAAQFGGTALGGASAGAIITSATPAFVALFAWLLLRERPTLRQALGLALAFGGVLLVVDAGRGAATDGARNPNALFGGALLVIAAVTWALYSVLVRRAGQAHGLSTLTITLGATVVGLMFDLPLAGIELAGMTIGPITPLIVLGVLYLGLVSTALAFHLWNLGFKLLDANTAALCFFAQPVVGATLGVLLLGEPLSFGLALGATLILGGALVSVARRQGG
jgi:drug/metabolite transporter (DMT)-like permease